MSSICIDCGKTITYARQDHGQRCDRCRQVNDSKRRGHYSQSARLGGGRIWRCEQCGAREDITVDHIVPISKGGKSTYANTRLLCRACNSRKGNR